MRKWTGPSWHTLQRRKMAGFYCYQLTVKGKEWFARWYEIMPINRWKREIREWQSEQGKLNEAEAVAGTWYRDESGEMRFKSNT
jgi:DNA-binding PadR family transcriptional regulator